MAVRVDQGDVNIGRAGDIDALFVLQPEFDLHQHAGFLLQGVVAHERDLQAFALDVADRRFPDKLDCHPDPRFRLCFINRTTLALIISKIVFLPCLGPSGPFQNGRCPKPSGRCNEQTAPPSRPVQFVDSPAALSGGRFLMKGSMSGPQQRRKT